jgi:outer membrane protein TolC
MFSKFGAPARLMRALALISSLVPVCSATAVVQTPGGRRTPINSPTTAISADPLWSTKLPQPDKPVEAAATGPILNRYYDPVQGISSLDLVRRALAANGELSAARLDVERGRARLRQAGLRPNPTLDFEQTTGRFTGSPVESQTSIGVALPLELGGKRARRIELAQAEI